MSEQLPTPLLEYKPLKTIETIRVLVLHPAKKHEDPLECRIIHQNRLRLILETDDENHYEAVSYTWENQALTHTLLCDDGTAILNITYNVDSFLRHFRCQTSPRYLWVDAICLNQKDNNEKSIQVGLMGDIFRQARRTIVWFGDASPHDEIPFVFSCLKRLAAFKNASLSRESVTSSIKDIPSEPRPDSRLENLFRRPWFQRRWTIQEVALGHDSVIHCGPYKASWQWFVTGLNKLQKASDNGAIIIGASALVAIRNATLIHSHSSELLPLLWDFHRSICLDPRDRIFALYGLAEDVVSSSSGLVPEAQYYPLLAVDYKKSWPDVYRSLALHCMSVGSWHVLLSHLFAFGALWEDQKDPSIPSWVPAWNQARRFSDFMSTLPSRGFLSPFLRYNSKDGTIRVHSKGRGREIVSTSREWPPIQGMRAYEDSRLDVFDLLAFGLCNGFFDLSMEDQETKDVFAPELRPEHRQKQLDNFASCLRETSTFDNQGRDTRIVKAVLRMMETYCLIKTTCGDYIGLGRGDIQAGDRMVLSYDTNTFLKFIPTVCLRCRGDTSIPSEVQKLKGEKEEQMEWKIVGPAFAKSGYGLWIHKDIRGVLT